MILPTGRALPARCLTHYPPPPDTVQRPRDLPNWPMLRHIAETTAPHRIDSRYYDLAGDFALRHTPPVLLPTR